MSLFCLLPCCLLLEEICSPQSRLLNNPLTDLEESGKPGQVHKADMTRALLLAVSYNKKGTGSEKMKQQVRQVKEKISLSPTKLTVGLIATGYCEEEKQKGF